MLGHFMAHYDDGAYVKVVCEGTQEEGTDIHTVNMRAAGIESRDKAKTFIYALLYGAGDLKLGALVLPEGTEEEQKKAGTQIKRRFLSNLPALAHLIDAVRSRVLKSGYLIALDGRRVYIRAAHAALNTLLQSCGSLVVKRWIVQSAAEITRQIGPQGWLDSKGLTGTWAALGFVHDEVQLAVRPEHVDTVKEVLVNTMPPVGKHFNLRCPLEAEAKDGNNWKETH